jgi:hypothetical protein
VSKERENVEKTGDNNKYVMTFNEDANYEDR